MSTTSWEAILLVVHLEVIPLRALLGAAPFSVLLQEKIPLRVLLEVIPLRAIMGVVPLRALLEEKMHPREVIPLSAMQEVISFSALLGARIPLRIWLKAIPSPRHLP